MSQSRRPSVSIYDYPEHLNPFNEKSISNPQISRDDSSKSTSKESKHKFWTFGRSRRKRSNSFSIKSTWNGLFGKRKESTDSSGKRSTITTVSSTYKRGESFERPTAPSRISRDQQEFDEALGTLARRRKYTLDNSSRCSSSLTVNGDPTRIYDGSPKETTTSILGDLTPKPPVRRFGQVSPRPKDKIPPLNYEDKEPKQNGNVRLREKSSERTPIAPMRRSAIRSSPKSNMKSALEAEAKSEVEVEVEAEETKRSVDVALRDENENVPEDYIFKRYSQDAVRRSNISINSCVSISSTNSGYTRKKRRAPQPPLQKNSTHEQTSNTSKADLRITTEPININRVTENIDELTKRSRQLGDTSTAQFTTNSESFYEKEAKLRISEDISEVEQKKILNGNASDCVMALQIAKENSEREEGTKDFMPREEEKKEVDAVRKTGISQKDESKSTEEQFEKNVAIEYVKTHNEKVEIFKEIEETSSALESNEVCLKRKSSSETLCRSDSFSVKDEIEKIEKQIKALESKNISNDSTDDPERENYPLNTRLSIQANRRYFFQNMVDTDENKEELKIEIKELPREQKDIHLVRLSDPPVPVQAPREPVKVIELHISEPIKQKPELLDDVNPIPKPRRHASLTLSSTEVSPLPTKDYKSLESFDSRGKSV